MALPLVDRPAVAACPVVYWLRRHRFSLSFRGFRKFERKAFNMYE